MRLVLVLVCVAACTGDDGPSHHGTHVDAGADAAECEDSFEYTWAELPGSSPAGALDTLHYSYAYWLWCGYYAAAFRETPRCEASGSDRELVLGFRTTEREPGTIPTIGEVLPGGASLYTSAGSPVVNATAEFYVTAFEQIDERSPVHFAGRFVVTDPGWNIDVNIDVVTQAGFSCTLF